MYCEDQRTAQRRSSSAQLPSSRHLPSSIPQITPTAVCVLSPSRRAACANFNAIQALLKLCELLELLLIRPSVGGAPPATSVVSRQRSSHRKAVAQQRGIVHELTRSITAGFLLRFALLALSLSSSICEYTRKRQCIWCSVGVGAREIAKAKATTDGKRHAPAVAAAAAEVLPPTFPCVCCFP